ncbi:substrate-binding domain-containing protein, partial [Salmonella enterica subsp. enterica serovar Virginia]|nr:substrate-binding domain-containing protein [Salmonella enterica subsp. enterica serovar Virginia]
MTPPLTTIHQPKDELGELAIDVLIHRMAQPALQQQRLQLTPVRCRPLTTWFPMTTVSLA